jgi:hypothetical protein
MVVDGQKMFTRPVVVFLPVKATAGWHGNGNKLENLEKHHESFLGIKVS